MTDDELKKLSLDTDGLLTYEYMANNIGECTPEVMDKLIDNMSRVDMSGQFLASAARYLHAIDATGFDPAIRRLVALAIDKDRRHLYLPDLLTGLYGTDYASRVNELMASDDNFRRIYKRLFPANII